jgi:hypothetical protein
MFGVQRGPTPTTRHHSGAKVRCSWPHGGSEALAGLTGLQVCGGSRLVLFDLVFHSNQRACFGQ